jgi:hypothetical protein
LVFSLIYVVLYQITREFRELGALYLLIRRPSMKSPIPGDITTN